MLNIMLKIVAGMILAVLIVFLAAVLVLTVLKAIEIAKGGRKDGN